MEAWRLPADRFTPGNKCLEIALPCAAKRGGSAFPGQWDRHGSRDLRTGELSGPGPDGRERGCVRQRQRGRAGADLACVSAAEHSGVLFPTDGEGPGSRVCLWAVSPRRVTSSPSPQIGRGQQRDETNGDARCLEWKGRSKSLAPDGAEIMGDRAPFWARMGALKMAKMSAKEGAAKKFSDFAILY